MIPPRQAWDAHDKATPDKEKLNLSPATRVRHDKIDKTGTFTLRHNTTLHHIDVGRAHKGQHITILIADLDIRVLNQQGQLLRHLTLNPTKEGYRKPFFVSLLTGVSVPQ
jgi:hypothetical protein